MNAGTLNRIENAAEAGAAALFAAAVGLAAYVGLTGVITQPELAICTAAAAIGANLLCMRALQAWAASAPAFRLAAFAPATLDTTDELLLTEADRMPSELVLTDADRLLSEEPLVLDDILAELGPDSRVVRLFDRSAMPTPGQLQSRIDAHQAAAATPADASQQLSEALAELRRSLR